MTEHENYLQTLSAALIRRGVDPVRTRQAIDEVGAHLADSGLSPAAEFGDPDTYADALLAADPAGEPTADHGGEGGEGLENYTFRATALDEVAILADLGRDGWELTGVREFGLIAQRPLDVAARRTWEYARCSAVRRQPVVREMTAEGWEPCGRWVTFHYFKRPVQAP